MDTMVGDGGTDCQAGKAAGRPCQALLKAPPVVVLDEATAHLDSESEVAIQRALKTALAGRTSLVIAHRLLTIREANQILVIDAGQIIERGTHEELLARGRLYADRYHTQFSVGQPDQKVEDADCFVVGSALNLALNLFHPDLGVPGRVG